MSGLFGDSPASGAASAGRPVAQSASKSGLFGDSPASASARGPANSRGLSSVFDDPLAAPSQAKASDPLAPSVRRIVGFYF